MKTVERFNWMVVLAFAAISLVAGLSSGSVLLVRVFLALTLLTGLAWTWSQLNRRGLTATRTRIASPVQAGQEVMERLSVTNRSRLGKLWVEIRDASTLPGHDASRVVSLAPGGASEWEIHSIPQQRGRYRIGPLVLHSSDPLGLFPQERLLTPNSEVLVHPSAVDLPSFTLPTGSASNSTPAGTVPPTEPDISGVRAYQPGDPLSRINWRTTARTGKFMVKETEPETAGDERADVWIVLDLEARRHFKAPERPGELEGTSLPPSTEEYAVTAAASLGRHLLEHDHAVGLLTTGRGGEVFPAARGPEQLDLMLDTLATVEADGEMPLPSVLATETSRFQPGDTLLVITPSTDEEIASALADLKMRGVECVAVLVNPGSFGAAANPLLLVAALLVAAVPTRIIGRGGDLVRDLVGDGDPDSQAGVESTRRKGR